MSIEKNRLLMEQQMKRLRGELNEESSGQLNEAKLMGSEYDWEQFVEKMNDGEDVRSNATRKQTYVDKETWVHMLSNQQEYQKAYPKVVIESVNEAKSFRARGMNVDIWIKKSPNEEISEKMYYALIEMMKKHGIAPNQIIVTF